MLPDLDTVGHFHFLRPWFACFFVPWAVLFWLQRRKQSKRDMFRGIIAPHLLEHLRLRPRPSHHFNPRSTAAVLAPLLLVMLMGPSWRQEPSALHEDEAALVILLDMSTSMEQRDVQPSRLQRSKQKIADLLSIRRGKKAALVAYSGSAHTILSLTTDAEILNQYLSATSPAIMPRPGKFPEYALQNIERILNENSAPATIVMFSDGLGEKSIPDFEQFFQQYRHQLLIVGVGTQSNKHDAIPLEKDRLNKLADSVGGYYTDMSIDDSDIARINRRIDSHYVVLPDSALPWRDSGYLLIFPSMLLFILWFRKGWTLSWSTSRLTSMLPLVLISLVMLSPSPAIAQIENDLQPPAKSDRVDLKDRFVSLWLTPDQHGRLLFDAKRYTEAGETFNSPIWKGVSYFYAEEFMRAAEYFSRSDTPDALFNEANARAHARDYVRALARYDSLLASAPDYPGAKANRSRVQALVDEINLLSESQRQEAGVSSEEKQRNSDDPIPAQGADEISWETKEQQQLSAAELLADAQLTELWLRGLSHNPENFLAVKFSMQLNNQQKQAEP